jgi:outer membrane murein-binding lipoprotein Lpp
MIQLFGHDITIPLAVLIFSTGCLLGWALKKKTIKQLVSDVIEGQKFKIEALSEHVKSLSSDLKEANDEARKQHDQRVQVVECIAVIEKDRDQWRNMYWRAGYGHSVAQNLLVAEMTRLSRILQRHNIPKSEVNQACGQVVDEFQRQHFDSIPPEERNRIRDGRPIATPVSSGVDSAAKCST